MRREIELLPACSFNCHWVSSDGRVFSDIAHRGPGFRVGRPRTPDPTRRQELRAVRRKKQGYLVVDLHGKQHYVHALVLTTWREPCPAGMECRHLDGDKGNNSLDNLTWGTAKENGEDNVRLGLQPSGDRAGSRRHPERLARGDRNGARLHPERMPRGERNGNAKLTAELVVEIRRRHGTGESKRGLSRAFNVSQPTIAAVLDRSTWRHVQ